MIPTIEEICKGLFAGDFTVEQAIEWLYQHMELTDARFKAAMQFAAAWLPIVNSAAREVVTRDKAAGIEVHIMKRANELGLAMADDLLRRIKETQT